MPSSSLAAMVSNQLPCSPLPWLIRCTQARIHGYEDSSVSPWKASKQVSDFP